MGVDEPLRQHGQLTLRQDVRDIPTPREGLVQIASLVTLLVHESLFELGGELQIELVSVVQRSRTDYLGKLADLLRSSQRREELSGKLGVVLTGEPLSGAVAHQSGQRSQRVNGWVDAARMNVRC